VLPQVKEHLMNIASILSGSYLDNLQNTVSRMQQFRKDFQQLGQDLQSGNLSAAQSDFATLQLSPSPSSSQSTNSVAQAFQQLSNDLQAGNLPAAQQDFTNLQQNLQNQAAQAHPRHHHHHHSRGGGNEISQLFSQLGQDLQSGDLASAQKAYISLQQDLQQYALVHGALNSANSNTPSSNMVNTTA
jgi:hypothetical protein